ncbi:MAG: hypothetical protein IJZ08_08615 [Clostridia bacterium]|nr:hypothetical protein [Clostridia bacterium]
MLDEESVKAYKSIRLERDLRADILNRHASRQSSRAFGSQKILRPLVALCSLILICTAVLAGALNTRTGIYTGNTRLGDSSRTAVTETVRYTDPRMRFHLFEISATDDLTSAANDCVPLRVKLGTTAFVEISEGALLLPDGSGNYTYAGFAGEITNGDTLYWSLTDCETLSPLTARFTDADGNLLGTVTLTYVQSDNGWCISGTLSEK